MEERSKTNKEIFEALYPDETLRECPITCAEAIGYLKALIQYFPSESKWVECKKVELLLIMAFYTL